MREHVSFVELPDNNYKPRADDPRAGYGGLTYVDYSVPIGEPMQMRYIRRHRLEKKDPAAATSEPVKPIQYWVDSGAPEDVKKALLEGAGWWAQAFEAAGFHNGFKVDILPDGADPMDIRYNMINWATARPAAGVPADRWPIPAPAKSSRARSPSGRCAIARIT
jgi:Domain of unknown function (DUF5117)